MVSTPRSYDRLPFILIGTGVVLMGVSVALLLGLDLSSVLPGRAAFAEEAPPRTPAAVGPWDGHVEWDVQSAVHGLVYRFSRNRYRCSNMFVLGGTASGDGTWPLCLDGDWQRLPPGTTPPWVAFQPQKGPARRDELAAPPPRRHGAPRRRAGPPDGVYFRPSGRARTLDAGNLGVPRQPEPLQRMNEAQGGDRTPPPVGRPAAQAELGNDPPCVIYVFGVDWDFSWEDQAHRMTGCETHSFDPSLDMDSHYRGANQWFWAMGLGAETTTIVGKGLRTGAETKWVVSTLADAMAYLNHTHISVLKIDIEGHEWDALAKAARDGALDAVDQLLFEVHMWRNSFRAGSVPPAVSPEGVPLPALGPGAETDEQKVRGVLGWMDVLEEMEKRGFRQYYHHTNPMSSVEHWGAPFDIAQIPCCFEIAFVRER